MKYLITSGGTEEPLDGVRYITNFSTGKTGAGLASYLAAGGHDVLLLHGHHAALPDMTALAKSSRIGGRGSSHGSIRTVRYRTFRDLDREIHQLLLADETIEVVVHLAAVSDYSPVSISIPDGAELIPGDNGKISSAPEFLSVNFKRNHKIITAIRGYAGYRKLILVGFKLTNTSNTEEQKQAVDQLLHEVDCDLLVHNDLGRIGEKGEHAASIYLGDGTLMEQVTTKEMLYRHLERYTVRLAEEMHRQE